MGDIDEGRGEKRYKEKNNRKTQPMKQQLSEKNPSSVSKHNKVSTFSVFSKNFQYVLMHFILPVAKQKQKREDSSQMYF